MALRTSANSSSVISNDWEAQPAKIGRLAVAARKWRLLIITDDESDEDSRALLVTYCCVKDKILK